MEYLFGFASSISRDLVCGAVDQLRYPCCFNNFVEDLAKEKANLVTTRDSVQDRVAHAKKQTRKTALVVDKWLNDANTDIDKVNKLLEKATTKGKNSSCLVHCPNWIWRYNLGRKLAKKKCDIKTCIQEGRQYIQLEYPASLRGYFSSEKCWEFDSRKSACEELMNALKDDEVTMIGLYGMGGCGKTMLAMEVMKRASHLFEQVLFVPVPNNAEVQRIQEKIASSLEFEFQEKHEMDRSQRLCMRLTQEDRILVILDDVWEMLDFDAIGIPSKEHHKGCKVLITTRSETMCVSMNCQKMIHLSTLTNDETWEIFQKHALISEGTSFSVKHLAREISNECKGLPVAIVAVASSLKGKAEVEWKVALNRLRSSKPVNIEKGLQNPYKCLQLSYDNLDMEEAKALFFLCSAFPEDYEIPVEILTRSAIGLGIVGEVQSYEEARNEVSAAQNKLISCCLLLDVDDRKCVKMHDLVRNVAH
ncbi:P-loop containing nucleoside triphosphate hydrolase [Sesbania bispinosa]|nr:P-loop containing nucleoside triphosphate hydrolase [Sesbania bispinosa]